MILKMFTVYDSKAQAYSKPFYDQSTGSALRNFIDATNEQETYLNKHPEDYTLFEIASFDDATGQIQMLPAHESLITGQQVSETKEVPQMNLTNANANGAPA